MTEARVLCAAPSQPDATKFSGAAGSDAGAGGPGSQALPLLSRWLCFLYVFWFTYLWGTDVCNSPASWSVGQKHLGWVICDLLAVDWSGKKNVNAGINPPQLTLFMGICIYVLCSVPFILVSLLSPIPHCLDSCSFIVSLWSSGVG